PGGAARRIARGGPGPDPRRVRSRAQSTAEGRSALRLVAEPGQQVAGALLEPGDVLGRKLRPPVAEPGRRRPLQALLVRLRGDVDLGGVLEHRRLVGEPGELADPVELALRVDDELLVAELVVAARPDAAPPPLSGLDPR